MGMNYLKISKKIVNIKTDKSGSTNIKIIINVKSEKSLKNVRIMDSLPSLAESPHDFGSMKPKELKRMGYVKLIWDIPFKWIRSLVPIIRKG